MGENAESPSFGNDNNGSLTHKRILWLMAVVAVLFSVLGLILKSPLFGLGILLGGILSFLNYYWLKFSLKKVFEVAGSGEKPRLAGGHYILRYLVFGLVLALIYLTKVIPIVAVILGLASFAFAIIVEGIIRIFSEVGNKREI